jgi:TRAP-type C4-dicarboxylate transport system substrate-binding protein
VIRALLLLCALGGVARADHVLRIATIVPDGTAWAREFRAFAREIDTATHGQTHIKYYFGGVAGDELQMLDRLRRDQLDGAISGGIICERLAPTFKVMRIPGLFQSQRENGYVLSRLKPDLDKEFLAAGFINLIESGVGADLLFTRKPVSNMNELRFTKLWNWDIDESLAPFLQTIGLHLVRSPLEDAGHGYDEGKHDGFIAPAAVALSWQWTAQAKYYTNLNLSYVSGCFLIRSNVFDALPIDAQRALRGGAAKIRERIDEVMSELEAKLLGGVLQQHGLTPVPVSSTFVSEFFSAAHQARDKALDKLIPADLVYRVQALLADFRASR